MSLPAAAEAAARRARRWLTDHPLAAACTAGATLRLAAVAAGCGWFAPDDLGLGIEQARAWLAAPTAPMADPIRSPILPTVMAAAMRGGRALGLAAPAHLLRAAYACLGAWSLLAIPATYRLARPAGAAVARDAAWLAAAYCLMPHLSVRALIEVLAVVPLVWGLVAVEAARRGGAARRAGHGLAAGLALGGATLLRFQVGLVLAPLAAWLLVGGGAPSAGTWRRRAAAVAGLTCGAAAMGALQLWMDLALGRGPFGTLRGYLAFNVHHSQGLGTSAWYTTLGHVALFTLPPAGILLWPSLLAALRRHGTVACTLVPFVALHACAGHKEDRFMFTMLPLLFVLLADALGRCGAAAGRWQRRAVPLFWGTNALLLACVTPSDAHRNVSGPLRAVAAQPGRPRLAAVGFTAAALPRFYLGERADLDVYPSLDALAAAAPPGGPDFVLLRAPPDAAARARLQRLPGRACGPARLYPGDWVDRVLVAANRHNALRAPTALLRCAPAAAAAGGPQASAARPTPLAEAAGAAPAAGDGGGAR